MKPHLALLLLASPALAGVHYSGDDQQPLPVEWRGYLLDLRALRLSANPTTVGLRTATPLRDRYLNAALALEGQAKVKPLSADDAADLGALYVRLGLPEKAVGVLRPAVRKHPDHFRLAANLGTAWQLAGDTEQAMAHLDEAVRLAPKEWKAAEELHLQLVRGRRKEKPGTDALDSLFDFKHLPADALPLAQQLAAWLPSDPRVLWQLAEVTHAVGDVRTAANLFDGLVIDFGFKGEAARERRRVVRAAADELAKTDDHTKPFAGVKFASKRLFPKRFDVASLPKIDPVKANPLPWAALDETEIGKGFAVKPLPYVADLDGKTVRVVGFMQPQKADEVREFFLTEFAVGCWFCDSPGPLQIVQVEPVKRVPFTTGPVTVTGKWKLNTTDPERLLFTITDA
ncbi:MAG: DUF3299 domain-containing protein, partial [Fimbriiglobus sp.]|nr:DUF3299 domain-containing protein [Fimbriiglobus sp.]